MDHSCLRPIRVVDASSYGHRLFFALGNREIQTQLRLRGHSDSSIARFLDTGLRIGTLLSDLLVQPTAHYCVPLTRQVALAHHEIFTAGYGVYALGGDTETYREDMLKKTSEYPSRKEIFQNKGLVEQIVTELESFGAKLYRGGSIGELTGMKWKGFLTKASANEEGGILGGLMSMMPTGSKAKQRLLPILSALPDIRGDQAFDWGYVASRLLDQDVRVPPPILEELRRALLRCYLASCKQLYGCELLGEPLASSQAGTWAGKVERYDIKLFLDVSRAIGVHDIILSLCASEIVDIKTQFDSFNLFRKEYFGIVDRAERVEQRALEFVRQELRGERETEAAQVRRVLMRSEPLLVECAKELGVAKNPSLLYYPECSPVYLFKKTFVNYADMPFVRFKDELVHRFGSKLKSEAEEAVRVSLPKVFAAACHAREVTTTPSDSIALMIHSALTKVRCSIEVLVPRVDSPARDEELSVVSAVLRYAAQELLHPSFISAEVTEEQFKRDMARCLQLQFGCPGVLREVQTARGRVDTLVMGVPVELKIIKRRACTRAFIESRLPQITEYIVGQCRRVGILCVLDVSKRARARPSLVDDVTVCAGRVEEGIDPCSKGVVAIVVILVRGALHSPSRLR